MAEELDFRSRMTQKAGPLPVWGWVVVVGAVAYLYMKRKAATQTAPATATTNDSASTTALYNSEYALALARGNANVAPFVVNPNVTVTTAPKDTSGGMGSTMATIPRNVQGLIKIIDSPNPNTIWAIENINGKSVRVPLDGPTYNAWGRPGFAGVRVNDPRATLPVYAAS